MVILLQQFLILAIIVFCFYMIYFYFRNKSKKYKDIPTIEMSYLMRIHGIDISLLGLKSVQSHIAIINSVIVSIDLLIYYNIQNTTIRLLVIFGATFTLILILYNILGVIYKKKLYRWWTMRKVFLVVFLVLILCSCSKSVSNEQVLYNNCVDELKQSEKTVDTLPFDLDIYVDKFIETEVMYRVIIDNPKVPLRNIETLVLHDKYTEDIYPSSGIFDEKLSLIPGVINKSSNYVEGIILVGYIPFEYNIEDLNATFKLLFKYDDDDGKSHTVVYSTKR